MSEEIKLSGQCLCHGVTVQASVNDGSVGACHCSFCRQWGGGPLLTIDCGMNVKIFGEELVGVFNSSDWAERGFCKQCGTHLFYRLKENQQYIMPAGLFEEPAGLHFDHQIFIDEKPEYYHFANATQNMTGQEVFEKFSAKPSS